MTDYTLHFLLSIVVVFVILFFKRKQLSKLLFLCGLLVVSVLNFQFFYSENFGTIQSGLIYVIGYAGAFWLTFFYLSLVSFKKSESSIAITASCGKVFAFFFLQAICLFLCFLVPWAVRTFPLSNVDAVLFTIFMPVEGANEFVLNTLKESVFVKAPITFGIIAIVQIVVAFLLKRFNVNGFGHCFFIRFVAGGRNVLDQLQLLSEYVLKFLLGCAIISLLLIPSVLNSPAFSALFAKSIDSNFYKNEYVEPQKSSTQVNAKKNLVVIFLESVVNEFSPFTPELNQWKNNGLEFLPGGVNTAGTGWTIAGTTGALCGLPINMPLGIISTNYNGSLPTYLPNAVCVMDVLKESGYNQVSVQGTDASYTQFRQFWKAHGQIDVRDDGYYQKTGRFKESGRSFWGMGDKLTFDIAREELDSLSKLKSPFAFYVSTIDTHMPEGNIDSGCVFNEKTHYQNALRCSSHIVGGLIDWMSSQPWFKNTVIMVVGDHTTAALASQAEIPLDMSLHTVSFFLNVPKEDMKIQRAFTSLDYAPTILEALGWNLPRHGFGLGRSLLSNEPTMLEKYGQDSLDFYIRQRNKQYDYFLLGK